MKVEGHEIDALVLEGGGCSVAAFYIGMFRGLDIEPVDLPFKVAGSSAGAIALALFVAGYVHSEKCDAERLQHFFGELFGNINVQNIFNAPYLISYQSTMETIRSWFPRLFALTMMDAHIITGQPVSFMCSIKYGCGLESLRIDHTTHPHVTLADAVYVSSSIPALVEPCEIMGHVVLDGDITMGNVFDCHEIHLRAKQTIPENVASISEIPFVQAVYENMHTLLTYGLRRGLSAITNVTVIDVSVIPSLSSSHIISDMDAGLTFSAEFTAASS